MVMPISDDFVPAPIRTVAVGQLNTVQATPAQIFRPALEANAPAIFIAHNNPQTDPQPSADDWTFTLQMLRAAALLRITIHDHLVISGNQYRSMRQENEAPLHPGPRRPADRLTPPPQNRRRPQQYVHPPSADHPRNAPLHPPRLGVHQATQARLHHRHHLRRRADQPCWPPPPAASGNHPPPDRPQPGPSRHRQNRHQVHTPQRKHSKDPRDKSRA